MTTQNSTSLTLSSATFAKLSPHPYLLANLQSTSSTPPSRANGRKPTETRKPAINTSSLTHAHGSALVRTGDTTVICGVRGETLATSQIPNYRANVSAGESGGIHTDELRAYDLLVPNIELATGCAPEFLPGVPPTSLAQTLSTRVYSLLHSSKILDVEDLRIYGEVERPAEDEEGMEVEVDDATVTKGVNEVKAYWVLYIDLLFVSLDGNPFDAAWGAMLAALRDTKLPRARWDADRDMVVCSRSVPSSPLSISGLPVSCTAAVFTAKERLKQSLRHNKDAAGSFWMLVDPDRFEESLCDETVTVVLDRSGGETKILNVSKNGGTVVGLEVMKRVVQVAESRWEQFKGAL
ncbi:exosome complex exonuclease RRP43 [Xylariaceae sp. FL0255]|nr:exosome complex exonuclease RRP43 [Xylariaceae sp. FL0255]